MNRSLLIAVAILAGTPGLSRAADAAADMAAAANAWLQSLEVQQRDKAVFPIGDTERENWNYVPTARRGIRLGDMNPVQQARARDLLAAGLSQRGQLQVEAIIALENVLSVVENSSRRDPQLYYFTVFGTPGSAAPWGWRAEGHHLSINVTLAGGRIAVTPLFFGANPAEVRIEHAQKGRRALAEEEDLGRSLMKSFDPEQRRAALIAAQAPWEIITGNERRVKPLTPAGLPYSRMNSDQQTRFRALLQVYTGRLRADLAETELRKITAQGWDSLHFAWAGSLEPGEGHYYRIQCPAFVIEYDNTQNRANHIHTVWRNFEGDFGRDLLREHYQQGHSGVQ
jgi:hypothetical protein